MYYRDQYAVTWFSFCVGSSAYTAPYSLARSFASPIAADNLEDIPN